MMPIGVSGQAKPFELSVIGGSALLPASRRCFGVTTTIGPVTVGWHTGAGACAAVSGEENWRNVANKTVERRGKRSGITDPRFESDAATGRVGGEPSGVTNLRLRTRQSH